MTSKSLIKHPVTTCRTKLLVGSLLAATIFGAFAIPQATLASNEPIYSTEENINNHKYQVHRTRVNAPPDVVFSVLTDYTSAPQIFSRVQKCCVVQDQGDDKAISFKVKTFKDLVTLEYVLNVHEHYPSRIEWSRKSGAFKINEGYWNIEGIDNGKASMVTYAKYVDAGPFTNFVVAKELRYDMPIILTQVKLFAENQSQNAKPSTIVRHPHAAGQKASLDTPTDISVVIRRDPDSPLKLPQPIAIRR